MFVLPGWALLEQHSEVLTAASEQGDRGGEGAWLREESWWSPGFFKIVMSAPQSHCPCKLSRY